MRILFLEWNSYCNKDMQKAFLEAGHYVKVCPFADGIRATQEEADGILRKQLKQKDCDCVFSFNYFPAVSQLCQEFGIPYVSWVYDSPYIHVYSFTVLNSCNYIFLFDYAVYKELREEGISTVYYLPLAVNEKRLAGLDHTAALGERYAADIAFVGALYDEPKHRLYEKFKGMSPYSLGYLDALVQAQKKVYGYNFLQELLAPQIVSDMQKAYPTDPNASTVMKPEAIYADYVLARQVTALERGEIMALLGKMGSGYRVRLYTNNRETQVDGVQNMGAVDYENEMPLVFRNTRINLNITLRSIKTGIPLRVFDIMGNGGFLVTNYQEEMLQYFEPDVDFVYYSDYGDLTEKVTYYLQHEEERGRIAENGCKKVRAEHTMQKRIEEMLRILSA